MKTVRGRVQKAIADKSAVLSLKDLSISVANLAYLRKALSRLTQLKKVYLWRNELTSLPDSLGRLTQLQTLDVLGNKLTSLPEWLGQLTQLQRLGLESNKLTSLPDSLARLTQLQTLDLGSNELTNLPGCLCQFTQLQALNLWSNKLTGLPDWLGQLTQLQALGLGDNKLTSLPDSFGQLTQLRALYLDSNQLTSLPDSLSQLTQLRTLYLDSNQLTSLPDSLSQLTQLRTLTLWSNQLTSLPDWLGRLTQLRTLNLGGNRLTSLPDSLGQLTQLKTLGLGGNQLTSLPEWLSQLTQLQALDLESNQLTSLPDSLGQLTQLQKLYLWGNSKLRMPLYAFDGSVKEILDFYYAARREKGGRPLHEIKALLLGEGRVGKTQIRRRLTVQAPIYIENEDPTHNFEVGSFDVDAEYGDESTRVRVNLFDFGGQPELHSSHRFFMASQRNLYLLTVRADWTAERNRIDYWLRFVRHHVSKLTGDDDTPPPAIIVVTHCDDQTQRQLPQMQSQLETLRRDHGLNQLDCVDHYDSRTGHNYDILVAVITNAVSGMKEVFKEPYPAHFFVVKQRLERWLVRKNASWATISGDYGRMFHARRPKIIRDSQARLWLRLYRDLGLIHYVGDRPIVQRSADSVLDNLIFNPNWMKGPVYSVIREPELTSLSGLMSTIQFVEKIQDRIPDERDRRYILALMQACELCFDVQAHDSALQHFLLPDHLPLASNPTKRFWNSWELEKKPFTKRRMTYARFMPDHLMLQFIGRMFRCRVSDDGHSRDGMLLKAPFRPDCEALVRSYSDERTVTVTVRGGNAGDRERFLGEIEAELRRIYEPDAVEDIEDKGDVEGRKTPERPSRSVMEYHRVLENVEGAEEWSLTDLHSHAREHGYKVPEEYDTFRKALNRAGIHHKKKPPPAIGTSGSVVSSRDI